MNINRGDQMGYLVTMSSNDFLMSVTAKEWAATDSFYNEFKDKQYRGDMNTTTIKTMKGKTIMAHHEGFTPRPYSRIHLIRGTKGMAGKWPDPQRISFSEGWIKEEEYKSPEEKFTLPIVKHIDEIVKNVRGHGGMDFTKGAWKTNKPVNLTLDGGGNTTVRKVPAEYTNN